jgi:malate/lactate dehydrogenase
MNVLVAGVGKLGSTVAFAVGLVNRPKKIMLYDTKDLDGDILDLSNALGDDVEITGKLEPADILIITAGQARDLKVFKTTDSLFETNKKVVESVVTKLHPCIKGDTKVIVMTNPVKEMTKVVSEMLQDRGVQVTNPEKYLTGLRKNVDTGTRIISTKGYTNFGPALSCTMLISSLTK